MSHFTHFISPFNGACTKLVGSPMQVLGIFDTFNAIKNGVDEEFMDYKAMQIQDWGLVKRPKDYTSTLPYRSTQCTV